MPTCRFTTKYYDTEIEEMVDFNCDEDALASGFCIFHDKDYLLQDKTNNEKHKRTVLNRLKRKVNHSMFNNEPLLCIGFQLPGFSLSDLSIISKEFTKPVYFNYSKFFGKAYFHGANFQEAHFDDATFQGEASFIRATFQRPASFQIANFQEAHFDRAKFQREARFYKANFQRETDFPIANFQGQASCWIKMQG